MHRSIPRPERHVVHRIDGNVAFGGEGSDFDEPFVALGRGHLADFGEVGVEAGAAVGGVFFKLECVRFLHGSSLESFRAKVAYDGVRGADGDLDV
jgi:hypothetical protein